MSKHLSFRRLKVWISWVLLRKSHLYPYLPLLRQGLPSKKKRIFDDVTDLVNHKNNACFNKQLFTLQLLNSPDHSSEHLELFEQCLDPCNQYLFFWYMLILAAIFYTYFETTIALAYGVDAWQSLMSSKIVVGIDWAFIVILFADMMLQLEVGFIRMGVVVTNRFRVIDRYLHYNIVGDVGLIVILMLAVGTGHYTLNYFKLIVLLKICRIIEINWLIKRMLIIRRLAKLFYVIARQLASTILFAHCIGIIFYAIDKAQLDTPACQGKNYELCWLNSATAYQPISQLPWYWQYFYSLYWGINIVCTIGYGDISPINPKETVFACVCFALCLLFAGYIVKQIVGELGVYIEAKENYRDELIRSTNYMEMLNLGIDSVQEVKDILYEKYTYEVDKFDADSMISRLPEDLKKDYYIDAYKQVYNGLSHFFPVESVPLLYSIQQKDYSSEETIIFQGQHVERLNFLHKGCLNLATNYWKKEVKIAQMCCPSSFFLTYEFFCRSPSLYNITTTQKSTIYTIEREEVQSLCQKNNLFRQSYHLLAYQLLHQNKFSRIFYHCFFCYASHHWYQCPSRIVYFGLQGVVRCRLKPQRISKILHSTLKDRSKLKCLSAAIARNYDCQLRILQMRVSRLQRRICRSIQLQVDRVQEWKSFLTEGNLSKLKAKWRKCQR